MSAKALKRFGALALLAACASAGDPPGGPPDQTPPLVVRTEPDSGKILTEVPEEAEIFFDEVIAENVAAQPPAITSAVILSPVQGEVRVRWHRDRLSIRPRQGFQPGRIYHLELLPVLSDLRNNKLRAGRRVVFSTGPEIPSGVLRGAIVDWIGARPAVRALIEAIVLDVPDSIAADSINAFAYRFLADSSGFYRIGALPPGRYLVRGGMDTNNDRRISGREIYDTVTVQLDTVAVVPLYAFAHDTVPPRLRQVELADSLTLRLTFTQPLDPAAVLDTALVGVALLEDSTTRLPLAGVLTPKMLDSLVRKAAEDSAAIARAAADSARRARGDTAAVRPDSARPAVRPGAARPAQGRAPLDSTLAQRMLAQRPAPSDVRLVRLAAPLQPDTRYVIYVDGVRNLTGQEGSARSQLRTPRPPRQPARRPGAPADTVPAPPDTTRRDTIP